MFRDVEAEEDDAEGARMELDLEGSSGERKQSSPSPPKAQDWTSLTWHTRPRADAITASTRRDATNESRQTSIISIIL